MRAAPPLGLLLLWAILIPRASAQPADETDASPDHAEGSPDYGRWVDLAIEEFAARRYPESLAAFRQAHELRPSARTLRGMAMTFYELRNYPSALRNAEAALASEEQRLTPALREHVEGILARSRAFVALYQVELVPSHAVLRVDSATEAWDHHEGRLILGLGEHRIRLTAPDHETVERAVTVVGGETETLRVEMVPLATRAPLEEPAPERLSRPELAPEPEDPEPEGHGQRDAGVAVLSSGIAIAVGAFVGIGWLVDRDAVLGRCRSAVAIEPASCGNFPTLQSERDAAIGVTIALGSAGLGLLSVGVALLLAD